MSQYAVLRHFSKKIMKPDEFFSKVFKKDKGDELLQEQIELSWKSEGLRCWKK